jgi:hypothetical protein
LPPELEDPQAPSASAATIRETATTIVRMGMVTFRID